MKTINKTTETKMIERFDAELKNILMDDLKSFVSKKAFDIRNKQAASQLMVA